MVLLIFGLTTLLLVTPGFFEFFGEQLTVSSPMCGITLLIRAILPLWMTLGILKSHWPWSIHFLNMNLDISTFQLSDLLINGNWDSSSLRCVFGDLLNDHILNVGHIDSTTRKRHVWFPVTNSNKIIAAVYSFFQMERHF